MERVPTNALKHLAELTEINLSGNNIKVIPDHALWNRYLIKLDISDNEIERIDEKAFIHVSGVRELKIEDNELFEIPKIALEVFSELEVLQMGGNRFSAINSDSFPILPYLRFLDILRSQSLRAVNESSLSSMINRETLKLSSNRKLEYLHPLPLRA